MREMAYARRSWRPHGPNVERLVEGRTLEITLVIFALSVGGAQRVLSLMANYWAAKDWQVTLITLSDRSEDHFLLDDRVHRLALDQMKASTSGWSAVVNNFRRVMQLRRALRASRAAVVVSFESRTNVLSILAAVGTGKHVIISERTDPRHHAIGRMWGGLRRITYQRAAWLVVQTEGLKPWAASLVPTQRCAVIENPVAPVSDYSAPPADRGPARAILSVGRLEWYKGFDLLLRAFADVAPDFPEWKLVLVGEGPERPKLEALARELGVSARFVLAGQVADPQSFIKESDLFVLASHYEGFPNVLLEAMAHGMAVICTDFPSDPRVLVRHGVNGLIVPTDDVASLAGAMRYLMGDGEARAQFGRNARTVQERFDLDVVMTKWTRLIDQTRASSTQGRSWGGSGPPRAKETEAAS